MQFETFLFFNTFGIKSGSLLKRVVLHRYRSTVLVAKTFSAKGPHLPHKAVIAEDKQQYIIVMISDELRSPNV